MEMDIPLAEELEFLEANSHLEEDLLEIDPPDLYPSEEDDEQQQQQRQLEDISVPKSPIESHKRPRDESHVSPDQDDTASISEKRNKIVHSEQPEVVEYWLQYTPPVEPECESTPIVSKKRFLSRFGSECFPVRPPNGGHEVYAKISRVEGDMPPKKLNVRGRLTGLIAEPIDFLLEKLEKEAFTKAMLASSECPSDAVSPKTQVINELLWVDKYAPNSFTELLSNEHTNREVLLWLKQWDSCVFGSEIRSTSDEVFSALRRHSSIAHHKKLSDRFPKKNTGNRWNNEDFRQYNKFAREQNNTSGIPDSLKNKPKLTGPPEQKILLLCGPPGLGKTTLAHIAANHCGYRVVEINASDDRSTSVIETKILDAVQMNSVMTDSRPKCLVIDEIDGALADGKGAVEVILKMVSAEKKYDKGEDIVSKNQSERQSMKKARKSSSLSRPVICICNDLYAPALRRLRQVARVHVFVHPTVSRVVSRLKYICNKEGMKTSSIALTALAQYTECDIRSCLSTLQFLNRKKELLNVVDLSSQVVGRKDISRGAFDIWKEIFQNGKRKQERKSNSCSSGISNEFDFLYSLISNRGDYDLLLDGIHENFLQLCYHDPMMKKTVKCFNALGISDLMHQQVMRSQQMFLYAYQPCFAITLHRLIAQPQKPNIEWPKSYQRCRTTLMEKMENLRSWHDKIRPDISMHLSMKSFVEDFISPLLRLLSPPALRPVASHLLSEKEKNDIVHLVDAMVSYFITYKNMKTDPLSTAHGPAGDALVLSFEPPIHELINFKGYSSSHVALPLATKQVLVHEVEKQKILQAGNGKLLHLKDVCNKEKQVSISLENRRQEETARIDRATSNLTQHNPSSSLIIAAASTSTITCNTKLNSHGNVKKPARSTSSFFDRFRKPSMKGSQSSETGVKQLTSRKKSHPLLFKFNEGFTNAIKRPVRMREFLL